VYINLTVIRLKKDKAKNKVRHKQMYNRELTKNKNNIHQRNLKK
jgi:hypothetical protein